MARINQLDISGLYQNALAANAMQQQSELYGLQIEGARNELARDREFTNKLAGIDFGAGLAGNADAFGGLFATDPERATGIYNAVAAMDEVQAADLRREGDLIVRTLGGVAAGVTPFEDAKQRLIELGIEGADTITEDQVMPLIYEHADIDTITGQVFGDGAGPASEIGKLFQDYEAGYLSEEALQSELNDRYYREPTSGPDYKIVEQGGVQYWAEGPNAGKPVIPDAPSQDPLDPKDVVTIEGNLRGDYETRSKGFFTVNDAYQRITAAASEPSAAGDLALIFSFMKMLDPGSTVREGEFANAQNAGGVDQQVRGLYNQIVNGQRLSEDQRTDFIGRAEALYSSAADQQRILNETYTGIAERSGANPQNVITFGFGPSNEELLSDPSVAEWLSGLGTGITVDQIRAAAEEDGLQAGEIERLLRKYGWTGGN